MYKYGKMLAVVMLAAVTLAACVPGAKNTNVTNTSDDSMMEGPAVSGTVKIGVVGPLSGDAAAFGEQIQRILDFYIAKKNEELADQNVQFELIYEDSKCTGSDAVSAFQKLTDIDGVKFILGGACSSETLAIAPLTQRGEALALSAVSSNPDIEDASSYVYTFSFNDNVIAQTLAQQMSGYERVAIISEQNDFNIGIQEAWLTTMIADYPEVNIVANEVFPKGATDMRSVLEKVRQANPEAILLNPNVGVTSQTLVRQLAEIEDWTGYDLYGQFSYLSGEVLTAAPETTEGMTVVDSPNITDSELIALKGEIEEANGTLEDLGVYYTGATLDAITVMTDLILEFGDDPSIVRNALTSRQFDGYISDSIDFSRSNFPGVGGGVYKIVEGEAVFQQ